MPTSRGRAAPPPRPDPEVARADRRARAIEEPLDLRLREDPRFVRLEVRNPLHGTRYEVVFPAYPARDWGFCTCTDFARRGIGTCKHLEASSIWLSEHSAEVPTGRPAPPHDPGWEEVDRRTRSLGRLRLPSSLRIRYPGAALLTAAPLGT